MTPREMAMKHGNDATSALLEEWLKRDEGKRKPPEKAKPSPPRKANSKPPAKSPPPPPPAVKPRSPVMPDGTHEAELKAALQVSEAQVAELKATVAVLERRAARCETFEAKVRDAVRENAEAAAGDSVGTDRHGKKRLKDEV